MYLSAALHYNEMELATTIIRETEAFSKQGVLRVLLCLVRGILLNTLEFLSLYFSWGANRASQANETLGR